MRHGIPSAKAAGVPRRRSEHTDSAAARRSTISSKTKSSIAATGRRFAKSAGFKIKSPNGVMCHLKALEKKGLITRESHMSRAIQLSEPLSKMTLPLAGRIAAGSPLPRRSSSTSRSISAACSTTTTSSA